MSEAIQFINKSPDDLRMEIVASLKDEVIEWLKDKEDKDKLLTREQVCELLTISMTTLHVWTKSGKLKSYGIGNRVYYKKSEILTSLQPL